MLNFEDRMELYVGLIETNGSEYQLRIFLSELYELMTEVFRLANKFNNKDNIIGELADVLICSEQYLKYCICKEEDLFKFIKDEKTNNIFNLYTKYKEYFELHLASADIITEINMTFIDLSTILTLYHHSLNYNNRKKYKGIDEPLELLKTQEDNNFNNVYSESLKEFKSKEKKIYVLKKFLILIKIFLSVKYGESYINDSFDYYFDYKIKRLKDRFNRKQHL